MHPRTHQLLVPLLILTFALALLILAAFTERPLPRPESLIVPDPAKAQELPSILGRTLQPQTGDFEDLLEGRALRVLVTINRTHFFLDGLTQRGLTADALREFENHLNDEYDTGRRRMQVIPIPVERDQLLPYLEQGLGDIAAANLTITPERRKQVDFSVPIHTGVEELIVAHIATPRITTLDDLAEKKIYVRKSSSFYETLQALNGFLELRGHAPAQIVPVDEGLETEDILELVNAGLIPMTVADSHIAKFWSRIFSDLVVYDQLPIRNAGEIAWAIRKDANGLQPVVNRFVRKSRDGTLLGNILLRRYLQDQSYIQNTQQSGDLKRFEEMAPLFQKYGERYNLDWLLLAAQAYQESRLDQSAHSAAGAIGVMQLLPATARDPNVGLPNITDLKTNIHAGAKYLRHIADTYFDDPQIDETNQILFALAAYNAGPSRIQNVRQVAKQKNLDPNQWFNNVELVAAERIGRQPVQYVRNIHKYHTTYTFHRHLE